MDWHSWPLTFFITRHRMNIHHKIKEFSLSRFEPLFVEPVMTDWDRILGDDVFPLCGETEARHWQCAQGLSLS